MNCNFLKLAKDRYSVRSFKSLPVEEEKIKLILEAARIAPTAKNQQPVKVYIVRGDALEKLGTVTPCIYGAPLVFAVGYDKNEAWVNSDDPSFHSGYIDASIVLTHMMLEATDLGLGSCWVCRFEPKKAAGALGIHDNIVLTSLLPVGYAADNSAPSPRHTQFKDEKDLFLYKD